jgi:hypothetical protein
MADMARGRYPALDRVEPAMQRADALEDQRAFRGRVGPAVTGILPLVAGRLVVFAGCGHSTSVAGPR